MANPNLTSGQVLPGFYGFVDFNAQGAGRGPNNRALLYGCVGSSAQRTLNQPFLPGSQQEADDGCERGSDLARFYSAAVSQPESQGAEIWLMPIAAPSGGVASIYQFKILVPNTNPSKSGTLSCWVSSQAVPPVGFTTSDTATTIAEVLRDALNTMRDLPIGTVTASSGVLSIPYKHKGTTGEDLPVRFDVSPSGTGVQVSAGTLSFVTAANGDGSVVVHFGALSVSTSISDGDTAAEIAAKVIASFNADSYPLAAQQGTITADVDLIFVNNKDVRRVSAAILTSTGARVSLGGTGSTAGQATSADGPFRIKPGDHWDVSIDEGTPQVFVFDGTHGHFDGGGFTGAGGVDGTIVVRLDENPTTDQTVIFSGVASGLAASLQTYNDQLIGAKAVANAGKVRLLSDRYGTGSNVRIVSGTALLLTDQGLTATSGTGGGATIEKDGGGPVLAAITFLDATDATEIPDATTNAGGITGGSLTYVVGQNGLALHLVTDTPGGSPNGVLVSSASTNALGFLTDVEYNGTSAAATDGTGSADSLVYNGTVGTGAPSLTAALSGLAGNDAFAHWAAPWLDAITISAMATNIENASDGSITGQKQQSLTLCSPFAASVAGALAPACSPDLTATAPHYADLWAPDAPVQGMELAARIAAARAALGVDTPQHNWNGFQFRGNDRSPILRPPTKPSKDAQNTALRTYALAPVVRGPSGYLEVVKGRTTSLATDRRLWAWSTVAQAAFHAQDLGERFEARFKGGSILRHSEPKAPGIFDAASFETVTREAMRAWETAGHYDGADALADAVEAKPDSNNPFRMNVKYPESPVLDLDQVVFTGHFTSPAA